MNKRVRAILDKVRVFAKQAKASGTGWHSEGGTIQCKNDRCTLGAIAFANSQAGYKEAEKLRKQVEKMFADFSKKVSPLAERVSQLGGDLWYNDEVECNLPTAEDFDKNNPASSEAVELIDGLTDSVASTIIYANDTSLLDIDAEAQPLEYAARQILEEVLLGKKPKKAA